MKKAIGILFVALICIAGCSPQPAATEQAQNDPIETVMDQLIQENEIPGLCFSIIYPDGTQEAYAAGWSDAEQQVRMTTDHVLFSGSIGKTYAAAVILQMVDEGRIQLDDRIVDYFPEIDWLERLPNINEITVEMCLNHTTGLTRYAMKPEVWATVMENPDKVWSYEDRFAFVFDDEPAHEAGKGWAYSDTNYILLGMLLEKVAGNDLYDEISTRILNPNTLADTHPSLTRDMPNLAVGHSGLPESFCMPPKTVVDGRYIFNPQMEWTGGGFASTTADLARWAKLYFTGSVFSHDMLKRMTTPTEQGRNIDKGVSCGMGSLLYETEHGLCQGHTGFMPGFVSVFGYYPEHGVAVALQVNADYGRKKLSMTGYLDRILAVALDTGKD